MTLNDFQSQLNKFWDTEEGIPHAIHFTEEHACEEHCRLNAHQKAGTDRYIIVVSWMRGLEGVVRIINKRLLSISRSEAKTKDKELLGDNKRINSSTSWDVRECGLRW